tara:strand:+ start:940 stop:1344 length:405 start_codon:yes stop_codon:yes gene_type:complete
MKLPKEIRKLCNPAKVYLLLSMISVIIYLISMFNMHSTIIEAEPEGEGVHRYTLMGLFMKIIFMILWVYILNYICQFKYGKKIAWFIVLLPFFFMGLLLIGMLCAISFIALQTKKVNGLQKELEVEKKKHLKEE